MKTIKIAYQGYCPICEKVHTLVRVRETIKNSVYDIKDSPLKPVGEVEYESYYTECRISGKSFCEGEQWSKTLESYNNAIKEKYGEEFYNKYRIRRE